MKCPICRNARCKIVETRRSKGGQGMRRVRVCAKCGYRFTTVEQYAHVGC